MRPDWKDAPDWANWLAMDQDGTWHWFEHEPYPTTDDFWKSHYQHGGRRCSAGKTEFDEILEKRP